MEDKKEIQRDRIITSEEGKIKFNFSLEELRIIADYYQFPIAVFLMSEKTLRKQLKGTSDEDIQKRIRKLKQKMESLIEKYI